MSKKLVSKKEKNVVRLVSKEIQNGCKVKNLKNNSSNSLIGLVKL